MTFHRKMGFSGLIEIVNIVSIVFKKFFVQASCVKRIHLNSHTPKSFFASIKVVQSLKTLINESFNIKLCTIVESKIAHTKLLN